MSAMPPNIIGSVLQSHVAQHQISAIRDSNDNQRDSADRRRAMAVSEQDTTVATTDADTQIHPDSQGTGGQGRAFSEPEDTAQQDLSDAPNDSDTDEGLHIDLQA